ncbi:integrator complex subunit 9-like [Tubulanus polymorphus]|uniref:integrator complex subunit 9-like n=1 Tax=Tubulanus polymorphus TaxID=672921 RepID=UPI003DA6271A
MKLYCLSGNANKPCFILTFKGTTILLDCSLDLSTLQHFIPQPVTKSAKFDNVPPWRAPGSLADKVGNTLKDLNGRVFLDAIPEFHFPETGLFDLSLVDVILISNSQCMLALPYITQYTGFNGQVYATEPTLQVGRQLMEELVHFVEDCPGKPSAALLKHDSVIRCLPPPLRDVIKISSWKQCYNQHDIDACLSKVKMIGYNEKLAVFGAVQVTAVSSGYCLGSCNWVIKSEFEKIVYLSGSSTLTTHPKPLEQPPLKNADILILSGLTQAPVQNPDAMIRDFCVNITLTLRTGGNVLVPCFPTGVTFDLFECLSVHMDTCGLSNIPMYFISSQADSSLAYSNIFAEWLSSSKQNKVYLPEPPFPHAELVKSGRLRHFASLNDGISKEFRQPCVVFTGHPSLRFGEVVHFLELWGKTANNMIVFTEPEFPYLEALLPYQPLAMKVTYCPIDTSLSYSQANKLIKELKPLSVVTNERYTKPPAMFPQRSELIIEFDPPPLTFIRNSFLSLPVRRGYERLEISPKLAADLNPVEVKPGVAVANVMGHLQVKDGKYLLEPLPKPNLMKGGSFKGGDRPRAYIWGNVDIDQFKESLRRQGIVDVKVEDSQPNGYIVHLPSEDCLIRIEDGSTHIICDGEDSARIKIRDALLACLDKL